MSHLGLVLRPFRLFADFHGRSTRTELIAFYFVSQLINVIGNIAGGLIRLPPPTDHYIGSLVLLCPSLALYVRRLHDGGRRGWWLLLMLPATALNLWRDVLLWQDPVAFSQLHLPLYVEIAAALLALSLLGLLLMDDQEGLNAWGPNPRRPDDVALPAQSGEPA